MTQTNHRAAAVPPCRSRPDKGTSQPSGSRARKIALSAPAPDPSTRPGKSPNGSRPTACPPGSRTHRITVSAIGLACHHAPIARMPPECRTIPYRTAAPKHPKPFFQIHHPAPAIPAAVPTPPLLSRYPGSPAELSPRRLSPFPRKRGDPPSRTRRPARPRSQAAATLPVNIPCPDRGRQLPYMPTRNDP